MLRPESRLVRFGGFKLTDDLPPVAGLSLDVNAGRTLRLLGRVKISDAEAACEKPLDQERGEEPDIVIDVAGNKRHQDLTASRPVMTDAVEKVFLGVRTNFYRGAGAAIRK